MLAERLGYMPIMCGNKATLLADTDTVIDVLIEDIDAAQHHVHILVYLFSADATASPSSENSVVVFAKGQQFSVGRHVRIVLENGNVVSVEHN